MTASPAPAICARRSASALASRVTHRVVAAGAPLATRRHVDVHIARRSRREVGPTESSPPSTSRRAMTLHPSTTARTERVLYALYVRQWYRKNHRPVYTRGRVHGFMKPACTYLTTESDDHK